MTLFWYPLIAASAHIFEEFVWPGGFTAWYRGYVPEITKSVSPRFLFWINAALLFGCLSVAIDEKTPIGPAFFLVMSTLLAVNGVFHLRATIRTHRYSPGVLTGTLLYIPLAIYGYRALITTHRVTIGIALLAALLGTSYHFLSLANHRRRARSIAAA